MTFQIDGYQIVRNVISEQLLKHLKTEFELIRDNRFLILREKNKYAYGDSQSPNSFAQYSLHCFESLAINLNDLMNKITGLILYPTYTYARIYYTGAILESHTDRPSCEYSTTICIDSTDVWNFYIKDRNGKENILKLNSGDMCVYSGCELEHWRKPYDGQQQIQCFLHYVNSKGPYKDFKYDKRPMMGIFKPQKNTIKYQ